MHNLLRILLDDLPASSAGFPPDRRERWLDAWTAAVRYVYTDEVHADAVHADARTGGGADRRAANGSAPVVKISLSETPPAPGDSVPAEVNTPSELARPSRRSRAAARVDAAAKPPARTAAPEPMRDPLGLPEPAPHTVNSTNSTNSTESALPTVGPAIPPSPPGPGSPPSPTPPRRRGHEAPLPIRDGGGPGSAAVPSYDATDPSMRSDLLRQPDPSRQPDLSQSIQPWYGFEASQSPPTERNSSGPPTIPPAPPSPAALPSASPPAQRSRAWTVEDDARLVQRFRAGFTPEQLADLFGRSASAVRERLMQLGVERR